MEILLQSLLGGVSAQREADTGGEFGVLQPTMYSGDGSQRGMSGQMDMPIFQDEVDCAFSWVKQEQLLKGWYLLSIANGDCCCLKRCVACLLWSMLLEWYDLQNGVGEVSYSALGEQFGYGRTKWLQERQGFRVSLMLLG